MAVYLNQQPVVLTKDALGNAWVSVAASADKAYQLVAFSGGSSLIACTVDVLAGGTSIWKEFAASGHPASQVFQTDGPVTGTNQTLAVRTQVTGSNAKGCTANLLYRIVL